MISSCYHLISMQKKKCCLKEFLYEYKAKNLVKQNTCFKSINNPSCIDLFLTNCHESFQNTIYWPVRFPQNDCDSYENNGPKS